MTFWSTPIWIQVSIFGNILQYIRNLLVSYLYTKCHFSSNPSDLVWVFYTTMVLATILDPRCRLFQNVGSFPLPTLDHTPSC